ncbi:inorganic phosphate transporter 1-4-like [Camellia sinensis]|uniref:inorganic phosphate transporter 1-4-like n=1 Tax=Camellia sinensis TaxID=4442 RepID=UPI0010360252|nr:inorganic phosphate transporter 1-4-like [Camellia sinensis]
MVAFGAASFIQGIKKLTEVVELFQGGQFGYASIYGELPKFNLKAGKQTLPAPFVASEKPWETIFSGSSHSLPPLTKLLMSAAFIQAIEESTCFKVSSKLLKAGLNCQNLFQKDIFSAIGWIPDAKKMNSLAIPYNQWTYKENQIGFIVMYSLTFFFANFDPNTTTFVVPTEIFLARLRSTCHGISAASGKAGAIVGAFGFLYVAQNQDPTKTDKGYPPSIGVRNALMVLGRVNFLVMVFTFLVPESKGKSLEEMS